jgi:oligopeptide/dipeptide ABC transporter ATP-binding protein
MTAVVAGSGLVKHFQLSEGWFRTTQINAVNGVDIYAQKGESLGVVGESGCGKSTLARMLVGIESPTDGHVEFEGKPVDSPADWRRLRRSVMYVFQDPYSSLPPRMTVRDIVLDPLVINHVGAARERNTRVVEMLDLVGIPTVDLERYPAEFSGGQRQRISIARALILNPRILICDEITSGLDVSIQAQVLNLLLNLQDRLDVGYVFISHDLRVVRYLCNVVAVMYFGKVVERGSAEEVFNRPLHPYTRGLLDSIPDHRKRRTGARQPLAKIAGEPPSTLEIPPGCPYAARCPIAKAICREVDPPETEHAGRKVRCHFPGELN